MGIGEMVNRVLASDVPMISVEEAKRMYDSGGALFLDVRKPDYFHRLRIAGSVSIPLKGPAERYFQLPRDRDIVIY